eukprot:TRINITY_DN6792_c0_g1_i2.p1 TRINITY_DN6792_c0_g1~~TRINITY_DN6792_c0_g1_i2.p1  ORF type:complete len:573 (-),score=43.90 TRINITY_DN6792_c0_g1_i2:312-1958(-)
MWILHLTLAVLSSAETCSSQVCQVPSYAEGMTMLQNRRDQAVTALTASRHGESDLQELSLRRRKPQRRRRMRRRRRSRRRKTQHDPAPITTTTTSTIVSTTTTTTRSTTVPTTTMTTSSTTVTTTRSTTVPTTTTTAPVTQNCSTAVGGGAPPEAKTAIEWNINNRNFWGTTDAAHEQEFPGFLKKVGVKFRYATYFDLQLYVTCGGNPHGAWIHGCNREDGKCTQDGRIDWNKDGVFDFENLQLPCTCTKPPCTCEVASTTTSTTSTNVQANAECKPFFDRASHGALQKICTGTGETSWHGISEIDCRFACARMGQSGCCETRFSGFCKFIPAGSISHSPAHTDTRSTLCQAAKTTTTTTVLTTCGSFGPKEHICSGSGGSVQWHDKDEAECNALCVDVGRRGCCETRTSGFCQFYPEGLITFSGPHKDTSSTMCTTASDEGTVVCPRFPNQDGCYVFMPSGCPTSRGKAWHGADSVWHGDAHFGSLVRTYDECANRVKTNHDGYDAWCGKSDAVFLWVRWGLPVSGGRESDGGRVCQSRFGTVTTE